MATRRRAGAGGGRAPAAVRIGEEIRMKIAQLLQRDVRDPRLAGVHVTRVEVSRDLGRATVHWRTTPGAATEAQAREGFRQAAGLLRSRVAASMRLRAMPELAFTLDELPETGDRVERLLAGIRAGAAVVRDHDDDADGRARAAGADESE